jgi:hypothetical protein
MRRGHDAPLCWAGALLISQSPMDADGGAVMMLFCRAAIQARWSILLTFEKFMSWSQSEHARETDKDD